MWFVSVSLTWWSIFLFLNVLAVKVRIIITLFADRPTQYNSPDGPYNKKLSCLRLRGLDDDDGDELFLWYGWLMKGVYLISSQNHCQRFLPSRVCDTPRAGFEPAQNLNSGLVEWSRAVAITTTPRRHYCWIKQLIVVSSKFYSKIC